MSVLDRFHFEVKPERDRCDDIAVVCCDSCGWELDTVQAISEPPYTNTDITLAEACRRAGDHWVNAHGGVK